MLDSHHRHPYPASAAAVAGHTPAEDEVGGCTALAAGMIAEEAEGSSRPVVLAGRTAVAGGIRHIGVDHHIGVVRRTGVVGHIADSRRNPLPT